MTSRKLEEALGEVQWGEPTVFSEHGISHRRATAKANEAVASSFGPTRAVFWARIDPGGFIIPHIDAGPYWERWHFPVRAGGSFWEDGRHFSPSEPFRVQHWLPHAVYNNSDTPRIHLIVDLDVRPNDAPESLGLQLTEMIPEVAVLIPQSAILHPKD